jgi:DNA repair exonuclease SbcCD ATPase subunit
MEQRRVMTNQNDLIERINDALDRGIEHISPQVADIFKQCRELLTPVLPDDVGEHIAWLRYLAKEQTDFQLSDIADMLERVWLERTNFERGWKGCCECEKELEQRIKELEKENSKLLDDVLKFQRIANAKKNYRYAYDKSKQHVDELKAKVEELEAMPKYHHPDCNWWKWDWRYSWDVTDCNCDKVAGPALKQEGE